MSNLSLDRKRRRQKNAGIRVVDIRVKEEFMALSLQEISDRFEIIDLLTDYCSAIDEFKIDSFDKIFTKNAVIDYTEAGGPKGDIETIKSFLKENLGDLPKQHIITNYKIKIDGDESRVRSLCYNPLEISHREDQTEVAIWGLWYEDKFIRTPDGWRILKRVTKPCFSWKFGVNAKDD